MYLFSKAAKHNSSFAAVPWEYQGRLFFVFITILTNIAVFTFFSTNLNVIVVVFSAAADLVAAATIAAVAV